MGQYEVRHQCDQTCADCDFYDCEVVWDSFGPVREEYCSKDHHDYVSFYSKPCEDFKEM
jgi:hypothetical protein